MRENHTSEPAGKLPSTVNYSRREFLTLNFEGGIDSKIQDAIEKYLGIRSKNVGFRMYFSQHAITDKIRRIIDDFETTCLLGEIPKYMVEIAKSDQETDNSLQAFLPAFVPGAGSNKEMRVYIKNLRALLQANKPTIVPTDPGLGHIADEKFGPEEILVGAGPLLIPFGLLTGPAIIEMVKNPESMNKREFLKQVGLGILVAIVPGIVKNMLIVEPPEQIAPAGSRLVETYAKASNIILRPNKNNPWMGIVEATVLFRNSIIALNTWNAVAKRSSVEHRENFFLMAGSAHQGIKESFVNGPDSCEKEVENWANELLTSGLDFLKEASASIERMPDEWVINELMRYSRAFDDPPFFNLGTEYPFNRPPLKHYPRTVERVFRDILDNLVKKTNNPLLIKFKEKYDREKMDRITSALRGNAVDVQEKDLANELLSACDSQYKEQVREGKLAERGLFSDVIKYSESVNRLYYDGEVTTEDMAYWWAEGGHSDYPISLTEGKWYIGDTVVRGNRVPMFREMEIEEGVGFVNHDFVIYSGVKIRFNSQNYVPLTPENAVSLDESSRNKNKNRTFLYVGKGQKQDDINITKAEKISAYYPYLTLFSSDSSPNKPQVYVRENTKEQDQLGVDVLLYEFI